jgi:hypothetical protein
VIGGVTAKVQFVLAADDETAARTWLAELGVEVTE